MLADSIVGIHHPCADILSPRRGKPLAAAGGFLAENVNALKHFVKDRIVHQDLDDPNQVPVGEGRICNINGTRAAVYNSEAGVLHMMSPVCTHLGCIVGWNNAEKSWDCPCHGGRFDATGKVLNGPPVTDLKPLDMIE
jgi:Rieske Fe-S protein